MTAEEFRKTLLKEKGRVTEDELMIEFAKLKVTEALKDASESKLPKFNLTYTKDEGFLPRSSEDKQLILTAYPLDLIK